MTTERPVRGSRVFGWVVGRLLAPHGRGWSAREARPVQTECNQAQGPHEESTGLGKEEWEQGPKVVLAQCELA